VIEQANGEYLMFCDPDDWYDVDTVEQLAAYLTAENLDVLRFSYVREFRGTSLKKKNTFLEERLYTEKECEVLRRQTVGLIEKELSHPENFNFLASVCFSAYKADIIKANQITFDNIREIGTFSDGLFNIKFLKYAERFRFLDKAFYHYRKNNAASATSNYRKEFLDKQLLLFDKIKQYIADQNGAEYGLAFGNRLSYSVMELCNNALKNQAPISVKYKEIRKILKNPQLCDAYKHFNIRFLPSIWRIYYSFVKLRSTLIVYCMTSVLLFIQKRGK
jgi:glycosyltransferase EpsH